MGGRRPDRAFRMAQAALAVLLFSDGLRAQTVRRTFVPQWHLGDQWDLAVEYEETAPDGRSRTHSNLVRFRVMAVVVPAPGRREVHLEGRPQKVQAWDRAHLVFIRETPGKPFDVTAERLWLSRLTVRTAEKTPRQLHLNLGAASPDPQPVVAAGLPLPVSFPVFEVKAVTGTTSTTFRPSGVPADGRQPVPVTQVLALSPDLPDRAMTVKIDRNRLMEYRLQVEGEALMYVSQVWQAGDPWFLFERAPGRRSYLRAFRVRQDDPLAVVERAGALAQEMNTPREAGALWSFRDLLTTGLRAAVERKDGRETGAPLGPQAVREATRELLGGFALPGLTATFGRMSGDGAALVHVAGLDAPDRLARRVVLCSVEADRWKIASGAQPLAETAEPGEDPSAAVAP